jgi:hypothetical protein
MVLELVVAKRTLVHGRNIRVAGELQIADSWTAHILKSIVRVSFDNYFHDMMIGGSPVLGVPLHRYSGRFFYGSALLSCSGHPVPTLTVGLANVLSLPFVKVVARLICFADFGKHNVLVCLWWLYAAPMTTLFTST